MPINESLYLIGFMGAGKTSVGRALAFITGNPVMDLDDRVEEEANMSIRDIFEKYGESYFRELESKILRDSIHTKAIITTGGGVVLNRQNREFLKKTKRVIFLKCDPEVTFSRIGADPLRPLIKNKTAKEIGEMYKERLPYYMECAALSIDTTHLSIDEIAKQIQKEMNF